MSRSRKPQTFPVLSDLPATRLERGDDVYARAAYRALRPKGAQLFKVTYHETKPEAYDVTEPFGTDVRWVVWRNSAGVWIDDLVSNVTYGGIRMDAALASIGRTISRERTAYIAALPAFMPPCREPG